MGAYLLGIDIGTSACKVAVFEKSGTVLAQSNQPYRLYYPHPGWVEQDADEWWHAICDGIRNVLDRSGIAPADIVGIGIDGQSWSAIPVDKDGNALARTPIWMDTRARDICDRVKSEIGFDRIFSVAGNDFLPSYTTPKMLWFKEQAPDIYKKTYKFLQRHSLILSLRWMRWRRAVRDGSTARFRSRTPAYTPAPVLATTGTRSPGKRSASRCWRSVCLPSLMRLRLSMIR